MISRCPARNRSPCVVYLSSPETEWIHFLHLCLRMILVLILSSYPSLNGYLSLLSPSPREGNPCSPPSHLQKLGECVPGHNSSLESSVNFEEIFQDKSQIFLFVFPLSLKVYLSMKMKPEVGPGPSPTPASLCWLVFFCQLDTN